MGAALPKYNISRDDILLFKSSVAATITPAQIAHLRTSLRLVAFQVHLSPCLQLLAERARRDGRMSRLEASGCIVGRMHH